MDHPLTEEQIVVNKLALMAIGDLRERIERHPHRVICSEQLFEDIEIGGLRKDVHALESLTGFPTDSSQLAFLDVKHKARFLRTELRIKLPHCGRLSVRIHRYRGDQSIYVGDHQRLEQKDYELVHEITNKYRHEDPGRGNDDAGYPKFFDNFALALVYPMAAREEDDSETPIHVELPEGYPF